MNFIIPFFGYQENCSEQEITVGELKELVRRCNIVLEDKREDVAIEELPTTCGFFFGSTDYDDYYYENVEAVRDWANGVIDSTDETEYKLLLVCWW